MTLLIGIIILILVLLGFIKNKGLQRNLTSGLRSIFIIALLVLICVLVYFFLTRVGLDGIGILNPKGGETPQNPSTIEADVTIANQSKEEIYVVIDASSVSVTSFNSLGIKIEHTYQNVDDVRDRLNNEQRNKIVNINADYAYLDTYNEVVDCINQLGFSDIQVKDITDEK